MSCGVGHRRYSDLALLWLWHSPAATALIRRLGTWEPPYAAGMALKRQKKKKKLKVVLLILPCFTKYIISQIGNMNNY